MKAIALVVLSFVSVTSVAADRNNSVCPDQPQTICEVANRCIYVNQGCSEVMEIDANSPSWRRFQSGYRYSIKTTLNCLTPTGAIARLDQLGAIQTDGVSVWAEKGTKDETFAQCQKKLRDYVALYGACK
jgi:hypothetical protein